MLKITDLFDNKNIDSLEELTVEDTQLINGGATAAEKIGLGLGALAIGAGLAPVAAGSAIVAGAVYALGAIGGASIGRGLYQEFKQELW